MKRSAYAALLTGLVTALGCPPAAEPGSSGPLGSLSGAPQDADARAPLPIDAAFPGVASPHEPASQGDKDAATAAGGTSAPFAETTHVTVPGFAFAGVELWRRPSAGSPHGTVIALGYPPVPVGRDGNALPPSEKPALFELDAARGTVIARRQLDVAPDCRILMTRVGDLLHLGVQEKSNFVWLTVDLSIAEVRRVVLPGMGRSALHAPYDAFGVIDGHAVVVTHAAEAYAFDEKGKRTATRDCRPLSFAGFTHAELRTTGVLTVIVNLNADSKPALCGFRTDGSGPTLKAVYDRPGEVFTAESQLYFNDVDGFNDVSGPRFLRIDSALHLERDSVADPRPIVPAQRCRAPGEFAIRDVWAWGGAEVVLMGGCCGGSGGLFLCAPGGMSAPPSAGTPGFLGLGTYPRVSR